MIFLFKKKHLNATFNCLDLNIQTILNFFTWRKIATANKTGVLMNIFANEKLVERGDAIDKANSLDLSGDKPHICLIKYLSIVGSVCLTVSFTKFQ